MQKRNLDYVYTDVNLEALAYMLFIHWGEKNAQVRARCAFRKNPQTPKLVEIMGDFCRQNDEVATSFKSWSVGWGNAA